MNAILSTYNDPDFINALLQLVPAVGVGLILGFIFAVLGWVFGLVWGLVRIGIE